MTVGVASEAGTNAVIFRGYDAGLPAGSLTPRTFPWRAVTIGVGQLVLRVDRTELVFNISLSSGTLPSDGLLGPGGFSLEIGTGADKSAFAIVASASTDKEQEFNWPNSGLSWSENDVVPVRLLRAPLPTAADSEVSTPEDTDYVFGADDFRFLRREHRRHAGEREGRVASGQGLRRAGVRRCGARLGRSAAGR